MRVIVSHMKRHRFHHVQYVCIKCAHVLKKRHVRFLLGQQRPLLTELKRVVRVLKLKYLSILLEINRTRFNL